MSHDKSPTDKLYSEYFPEIDAQDPVDGKYKVNNPFSDEGFLELDTLGDFTSSDKKNSGFITDFFKIAEGIPESEKFSFTQNLLKGNKPPDYKTIKLFNDALLTQPENIDVFNYLTQERKLSRNILFQFLVGYDAAKGRIIFPIMNLTRSNASYAKYIPFTNKQLVENKCKAIGGKRLFGYHDLKFGPNDNTTKYIVFDEFDALLLRQNGFESFCPIVAIVTSVQNGLIFSSPRKLF